MRLTNLQALRGAACLLIVVYHVGVWEGREPAGPHYLTPLHSFGFAGVDLFFVLSGFVITWSNAAGLGNRARLPDYLGRRLWRIYPLYWACWLLAVPLTWDVLAAHWGTYLTAGRVTRFLLLVPTADCNSVLPPAWTLCFEVLFYVTFAGFFLLPRRLFVPALGLWATAVITAAAPPVTKALAASHADRSAGWLVNPFVAEFLLGCFAAVAIRCGWTGWGRTAIAAGAIGLVAAGVPYKQFPWVRTHLPVQVALFAVPAVLIVYGVVAVELARGWRLPRWLQVVGDASYSIYLIHVPAGEFVQRRLGGLPEKWPGHLLWFAGLAAVSLAAGFLMHVAVERPLQNLARRRPAAPAPALRRAA